MSDVFCDRINIRSNKIAATAFAVAAIERPYLPQSKAQTSVDKLKSPVAEHSAEVRLSKRLARKKAVSMS
jgi:hypothetical protein